MKRFLLSAVLILSALFSFGQVVSNFSAGTNDGWTVFNLSSGVAAGAAVYNAGGYITDGGILNGQILCAEAPAKFRGNFSSSYKQNLTFDVATTLPGIDNTNGDVIIAGTGGTLYFQLPTKPVGTGFNSYIVKLDEAVTGWHFNGTATAAPTQTQMKAVLSNITYLRIRTKYNTSNTFTVTGSLDNVVLNVLALVAPPIITSFTPASALPGATVTLTGVNFNTTLAQNIVYFNGVKATVTNASATQLIVTVPASAAHGQITAENLGTGLQGTSTQSFNLLFDNNKDFGGRIIPATVARGYYSLLQTGTETASTNNSNGNVDAGDFDGDGWVDLVESETGTSGTGKIYVFRNSGTGGAVSAASFATALTLSLAAIPGGSPNLGELTVADVDSDGKLDIAAVCSSSTGFLAVFRNTSTAGAVSFASPLFFAYPYYSSQLTTASTDFDSDGRIDFVYTTGTSPGGIWMNQNLSTPGNVDFSYGISVGTSLAHTDISVGDLNSDGKPELIASLGNALEVYQNTSTLGVVSFNAPFNVTTSSSATSINVADLDVDNKLDFMWCNSGASFVYFSQNIYNGSIFNATSFGSTIQVASKVAGTGLTTGDINGDSKPDIVVSGTYDLAMLENVGTTGSLSINSFLPSVGVQGSAGGQPITASAPILADLDGDSKAEVMFIYTYVNITAAEKGIYIFHNESYPVPNIASITPPTSAIGATVALNGDLMFTGSTTPTVRFSNIKTTVSGSPTNTLISTPVPSGSISGKFLVSNHGLTGFSPPFNVTFGTSRVINATSFGSGVDFNLNNNTRDALEIADFDDDGKSDVVVIDNFTTAKIFQNTSTAGSAISASSLTLQSTTYTGGYNTIALDIDGDGKTDLNNGYGLLQNNGTGSISFLSGPNGVYTNSGGFNHAAAGDFNKDGKTDLALANGGANIQIYENQSTRGTFINGTFSTFNNTAVNLPKTNNYGGIVAADFDNDGYDDLASANPTAATLTIYANQKIKAPISTASFSLATAPTLTGTQPFNLTASDFDGDGKIDIAVTYNTSTFISVFRNTSVSGTISFAAAVDLTCLTKGNYIASQDLDGDGKAEIVVTHRPNPGPGSFSVFQNKSTLGTISFNPVVSYSLTAPARNPQALAIADINLDQKPDILIVADPYTAPSSALIVFENKIATVVLTVSSQPIDASVCNGGIATFAAAATGTSNITYQWQYSVDGIVPYSDITNSGGYSNVPTSTLSVNTTGTFGAGRYRCKISGDFVSPVFTSDKGLSINSLPVTPTTTGGSLCGSGSSTLSASGGTNGQYRWYTLASGGTAFSGEVNSTYVTPSITTTTNYYVSINNGTCEGSRAMVTAQINTIPSAPTTTGASSCTVAALTLTAFGGTNGQYRWYTAATGGTAIAGEVNSTYTTPSLTSTTNFFVAINNGSCESTRTTATATIQSCTTNQPPVIAPTTVQAPVEGKVTVSLASLLSDPDNNLDLSSLKIIVQPASGAKASINAQRNLILDYTGISFSGTEKLTIEVCDLLGACAQKELSIEVVGDVVVFNGISPNNDGKNEIFFIQYIDVLDDTKKNHVFIYNRWGDLVFDVADYDNKNKVFRGLNNNGNEISSGTYFYKIEFEKRAPMNGYLTVKR